MATARKHAGWEARPYVVDPALHLGLVGMAAKRYHDRPGLDYDERFGVGCLGLVKAAKTYDPSRNCTFSTYAYAWIRSAIQRAYQAQGHAAQNGRARAPVLTTLQPCHEPACLDDTTEADAREHLQALLLKAGLTSRMRRIVARRMFGHEYAQIGATERISGTRVRTIYRTALERIRAGQHKAVLSDSRRVTSEGDR